MDFSGRQAARRVERPMPHRIRDAFYLVIILAVGILAIIGLISGTAFLSGASFGQTAKPNDSALATSRAEARAIVRRAEREQVAILAHARRESARLIAEARARARRIRSRGSGPKPSHGGVPTAVPTRVVAPTPTPTIPGAPNLSGFPASWLIIAFNVAPSAGTGEVVNRSAGPLSGSLVVTYLKQKGHIAGVRIGHFVDVPGRSVATVAIGRPPTYWATYRISVRGIH